MRLSRRTALRFGSAALGLLALAGCTPAGLLNGVSRISGDGGARLAVLRDGDSIAVMSDRCPHAGGSLGSGWVEDGEAVCPLHRWRFRLRDGRCDVPGHSAHVVECRVESGGVWGRIG